MDVGELAPQPAEHTFVYHDIHYELERWTVFRMLPQLMKFDQTMLNFFRGLRDGTLEVPNFEKDINPPSLWAYYSTLP